MNTDTAAFEREDWWDSGGAFRLLHDINPLRLQWVCEKAEDLRGKRLLDVGCGGGIFAESAAAAGAIVCGLDSSAAAIRTARQHAEEGGLDIRYHHGDSIQQLPQQQYDIITCFEVLEHTDAATAVADIADRLPRGGLAVFSTINQTLRALLMMVGVLEQAAKIIPAGTHDYQQFITPEQLARYCRRSGLSVSDVRGLQYSFFGHYYFLTNDTGVNYFLSARRR